MQEEGFECDEALLRGVVGYLAMTEGFTRFWQVELIEIGNWFQAYGVWVLGELDEGT